MPTNSNPHFSDSVSKEKNEQAMLHAQNKSDEKAIKNLMFTLPGTSIPLSQRTESKQEKLF